MRGRERLLAALKGKRTDSVPVTLFIQSQGHFVTQLAPHTDPWDFEAFQKQIIDYQRSLGADVHVRMLFFNPHEPVFAHFDLLNVQNETKDWHVAVQEDKNGKTVKYRYEITTPEGMLHQTFSIYEGRPGTFMYGCTEPPIKNQEDLRIAMKYEPPYSDETKEKMKKNVTVIKEYLGDDGIVSAWSNGGMFNNISALIDQTELYALFLTEPEFYEELMSFAKKRTYAYTDILLETGVDAICVGGNAAGGFLGNTYFHDYVLDYEKDYIAYCQRKGNPVIYHNCGRVMELIPSYKEMGAMNIEPFSPDPLGNGDLDILKDMITDEFSVTSGVDQIHLLQKGTKDDVIKATLKIMEQGKQLHSFIMQNVDFLEYGTPKENVEAFVKTALANAQRD